jgi:putative intracellular protease/amidase
MNKIAYLYVFDTMADWEIGYLTSELNSGRYFKKGATRCTVRTVGLTTEPIVTMGGMHIIPDITVEACSAADACILILPGGDTWLEPTHNPIIEKVKEFLVANIFVAAICGATVGLAQSGLLDNRKHTSNDLGYMKAVSPDYAGEAFYRQEPAVTDKKLITASGIAPLDFTHEVLKELNVFSSKTLEAWYKLYQTHDAKYFFELMDSLQD